MTPAETRDFSTREIKEMLQDIGACGCFLNSDNHVLYQNDFLSKEGVQECLKSIPELFQNSLLSSDNTHEVVLNFEFYTLMLLKFQSLTLGLFYEKKPKNTEDIITLAKVFLKGFHSSSLEDGYNAIVEHDDEPESLSMRSIASTKVISQSSDRIELEEGASVSGSPFDSWNSFKPHFLTLLSSVMNADQSKRLLERILAKKGLPYGPEAKEIGHVARELIIEIPHRKKRKQLLSELHDILIKSGVEERQENVIGFKPR